MKERNIFDIHSVYLKSRVNDTSQWERIEGVNDGQARLDNKMEQNIIVESPKLNKASKAKLKNIDFNGAVRRVIKFLK
ncbi:hypothetical protein [Fluviispira sanaruensis]|uniref:Uncharacterized protein n=1 Tax=Fluviispira sanaruensis TaxID=2493639 RepID=A0A4P2VIC9_FLUSA|nr:hypothetical protein [Fluviispira sanaruensis]BBH52158.1 hypothetical protein JCM31447_05980 [Fluviispira sanaruensis]